MAEDIVLRLQGEMTVPGTGEIVNLEDPEACGMALAAVREFKRLVRESEEILCGALEEHSKVMGSKTIHLPSGQKAVVSSGRETVYDAQAIERDLREAGMPEERLREIVEETVSYSVKAVEAKRAAGANPEYDRIIREHSQDVDKKVYVSIRRG